MKPGDVVRAKRKGTIIERGSTAFYIRWEDGSTDWIRESQLELVEDAKADPALRQSDK